MGNQLEALARIIAEKNNLEMDAVLSLTKMHADSLELDQVARKVNRGAGKREPRTAPDAEHRCMARVWGDGSGNCQCKSHRAEDSDYCKRCLKKANICDTPCTLSVADAVTANYASWKTAEGARVQKLGLYCGRIDQPIPSVDAHGILRIIWKNDDVKAEVAEKLESGEWTKPTMTQRKKKAKTANVPKTLSENDEQALDDMLSTGDENALDETQNEPEVEDVADAFTAPMTTPEQIDAPKTPVKHADDDTTNSLEVTHDEPAEDDFDATKSLVYAELDGLNASPENSENEEEEEEEEGLECRVLSAQGFEVDEDYEGVTYNVAGDNTIYSDEGEEVGMWTKNGPKLFQ